MRLVEPSADVIRKAFKLWKRKYSLKATVHFLIQQLISNNMINVAQHICEELEKRNIDGRNSESDAKGEYFAVHIAQFVFELAYASTTTSILTIYMSLT